MSLSHNDISKVIIGLIYKFVQVILLDVRLLCNSCVMSVYYSRGMLSLTMYNK